MTLIPATLNSFYGLVLGALWLGASPAFAATHFTARGTYLHQTLQYSPKAIAWTNAGAFEVIFDDCKWSISLQPEPLERVGKPPLIMKNLVAVFDGAAVYELQSAQAPPELKIKPVDSGQIGNGPVPQRIDQRIQHIWLGIASGCFFKSSVPGYHPRLSMWQDETHHDNSRLIYTDWSINKSPPYLPFWVAYFDGEKYENTAARPNNAPTNLFFEVSVWTNLPALMLPKEFQTTGLFSGKTTMRTTCVLTSVTEEVTSSIATPSLSGETFIFDRRLTDGPPFVPAQHMVREWPSVEASRRILGEQRHLAALAAQKPRRNAPRIALLVLIVGLAPIIGLFVFRVTKQRTEKP